MRCKTCHYSLENLTGPPHRCPECGTPFDPNDPTAYYSRRVWSVGMRLIFVMLLILLIEIIFFCVVAPMLDR